MIRSLECAIQKAPMHLSCVTSVTKCTSVIVSWRSTYNPCTRDCDHTNVNIVMRHTLSEVIVLMCYLKFMRYYDSDAASPLRRSSLPVPSKRRKWSTEILAIFHCKSKISFLSVTQDIDIIKLSSYFFLFFRHLLSWTCHFIATTKTQT